VEVKIRSESGRISLNRATDFVLRKVVSYFVEEGEQRSIIVDSILDWRDTDNLHRLNGAENDYYQSLAEPYNAKDADFDSVDELLLVRGISPELYHGKKAKDQEGEGAPIIGLKDVFTVFSNASGIDINTAPVEVLMVVFGISRDLAQKILESRSETPFGNLNDFRLKVPDIVPFITPEIMPYLVFTSVTPYYNITSVGKVKDGESKRGMECVVKIDRRERTGYRIVLWNDVLL
jgi:general secretion pathway protein K